MCIRDRFNKDVILYAPANDDFTYSKVFEALKKYNGSDSELYGVKQSSTYATDNSYVTSDEYYKIIGFDGIKGNLESNKNASNNIKLDVSLNEYKVMFMVDGKFEVVSVAYGENPLDKCTLISGMTVDHWVTYLKDVSGYTFNIFNFTTSGIKSIEENAAKADKDKVVETFIACFYPDSQTGYAVFNAVGGTSNNNPNAYFGSKEITEIIVTGKLGSSIPMADAPSSSKDHWLFFGWNTNSVDESKKDMFVESTVAYNAIWDDYKHAVTFYNGSEIVGVFYYSEDVSFTAETDLCEKLVGIQYDGKLYKYDSSAIGDDKDSFAEIFDKVIYASKKGYLLNQWNDVDGNSMIVIERGTDDKGAATIDYTIKMETIKSDINLYGQFEAKEYAIKYINSYNSAVALQTVHVDETVTLYGESTFIYNGYKLVSWNERADGNGVSHKLGESFTLTGEQFEKLSVVDGVPTLTLYASWDSTGSNVPGDNTGGDSNDNTALYLIAGMLAVIAILAIVGIVLMRKK